MRLFSLLLTLTLALSACTPPRAANPTPTPPAIAVPLVTQPHFPGDLPWRENCPINPQCKLSPLLDGEPRGAIAVDLNDDGLPEYFVEDMCGAHSIAFVLVDRQGISLLPRNRAIGSCDRILVLASTHNGYHDILSSYSDLAGVDGEIYEYNGRHYTQVRNFSFKDRTSSTGLTPYIELVPGVCIAHWYADVWSRPPGQQFP
jgi:hypothetical protein